jgi:peroxiredoxin
MALTETPQPEFGTQAPNFSLEGVDGHTHTLESCMGENGLLVMFICNHCPYVRRQIDRIIDDTRELSENHGIGVVAIMSNDVKRYPEDGFEKMQLFATELQLPFPYVWDKTQEVAHAYGAVCTPDFFGFNKAGELQFRGRLEDGAADNAQPTPELLTAMKEIAATGKTTITQHPSIGCSIKWFPEGDPRAVA